jgi:hypothetical protein
VNTKVTGPHACPPPPPPSTALRPATAPTARRCVSLLWNKRRVVSYPDARAWGIDTHFVALSGAASHAAQLHSVCTKVAEPIGIHPWLELLSSCATHAHDVPLKCTACTWHTTPFYTLHAMHTIKILCAWPMCRDVGAIKPHHRGVDILTHRHTNTRIKLDLWTTLRVVLLY